MENNDRDWLRFVVTYTAARLGLLLALVLLGAFAGSVLFPSLVTFLPRSMEAVKDFMTETDVRSVIGTAVICLLLVWVFYDDARKHTAYDEWSMTTILTVLILVGLLYFIPAIFRDSFHAEGKAEFLYTVLYYPAGWVVGLCSDNYLVGVLGSILVMLGSAFAAYVVSYKIYVKKHPVLLERPAGGYGGDGYGEAEEDSEDREDRSGQM